VESPPKCLLGFDPEVLGGWVNCDGCSLAMHFIHFVYGCFVFLFYHDIPTITNHVYVSITN